MAGPPVLNQVADWGAIVVETDIDRAVIGTLMTWLPTYLTHIEDERGYAAHLLARPQPGSYQNALEDDTFPDAQLPAIVVTTAKTEGDAEPRVNGYSAGWRVAVSAIVRGSTPPECREVAALFGGCVRAALVHQQITFENGADPGGELKWLSSEVVAVPDQLDVQGRWLAACLNTFIVYVDEVLTGNGPLVPDADSPYPPPDPSDPDAPYDPLWTVRPGGVQTTVIPKPRS